MLKIISRLFSVAVLTTSLVSAQATPPAFSPEVVAQQASSLEQAIRQAVTTAGGDLSRQHLHLVFAFSTGHFAKDPLLAEAARAVATQVAVDQLVPGDSVSAYAYEMDVWDQKGASLNPMTVPGDLSTLRAGLQDLWPRSPQAGSAGGHDTEQAIVALTHKLSGQGDAVLVLLTNSAASVAGDRSQRIIGENAQAYRSALAEWTRVRTSTTTGASSTLSFAHAGSAPRTIDAVLVTPKRFSGAALSSTRSELLQSRPIGPASPARPGLPWWLWAVAGLALLALVLLVVRLRNSRGLPSEAGERPAPLPARGRARASGWALQVAGRSIPLQNRAAGDTICVLCGPGYPVGSNAGQYVLLSEPSLPADKLLTIVWERGGLKLVPEGGVNLAGEHTELLPLKDEEYRLRLSGRASRQNLPPRPYQADLTLTVTPLEPS